MSDEHNSPARQPAVGARRVSVFVAAPVVVGCAVLGSVIGTTHPLQSMFSAARSGGELNDLRPSSLRSVEPPAEALKPSSGPHGAVSAGPAHVLVGSQDATRTAASPPAPVVAVSTGSVDRPLSAGGSGDVAATQGNRPDLVPPEAAPRATNQSHRQARAKRLRRMLGRHARPKSAGAQVDAFISSILPTK